MRIGIDLDGVLADTLSQIILYHNSTYGTDLKRDQFLSYGYHHTWGGTKDEAIQKLSDFYKSPYFLDVLPIIGAKRAISILRPNNDLFVITSRPHEIKEKTFDWINKHFPDTFLDVFLGNHYSLNGVEISKNQICNDHGIDILIEDSIEYALECIGTKRRVFLLDAPWNQLSELPLGLSHFSTWSDITKAI